MIVIVHYCVLKSVRPSVVSVIEMHPSTFSLLLSPL